MESQGIEKDRLTKEVEAESVAYCVCSAFELDTSEYSFPYIAGWSSGKEMRELKASMNVIRKTAGEMIDELTEKIEMMLEQKQEKLLAAVEAAGYRFAKEESNSQHLQFIPDGTHRMQGHLFAKSWNEVERWVEAIIEKGDPIQKERVERVIYPERFEQSFEEMMFTRKECRLSIYHLDKNGSGRDQLFVGMEDLQEKGITITADQYRCVYSSLYLPNEDMNAIYSIFNDDPPADYKAHSLSVSDVVIMNQNGDMKAYFVDRFGFQELPDFVEERKKILGMENDIQKKDILEQTSCISFYAAECSEFPILGEVHHDLTLPEALEAYEKIPAERMNGLKSVGFNLQEGSDYDGMMDLMVAGRSQREILEKLNEIGGQHGIGIIDIVENRVVGMKSRGVYETPGGTILMEAHQQLEELILDRETLKYKRLVSVEFAELVYAAKWFSPLREALTAFVDKTQEYVTGTTNFRLYKGNIIKEGTTSPYSLYDEDIASFKTGDLYDHHDAEGFITLYGLSTKVRAMKLNNKK